VRILFLCTGNSCRSQIAEGFGRALAPEGVEVLSAGSEPRGLHPLAVEVMAEVGVDISGQRSKDLSEVDLDRVDLVVSLCVSAAERCPVLPSGISRRHWPIPDPAEARGSREEVKAVFRAVRDEIGRKVKELLGELA
jgi:arsenate reductase